MCGFEQNEMKTLIQATMAYDTGTVTPVIKSDAKKRLQIFLSSLCRVSKTVT